MNTKDKALAYYAKAAKAQRLGRHIMAKQCQFLADYFAWHCQRETLGKANKVGGSTRRAAMKRLNSVAADMRQSFQQLQR